MTNYDLVIIGGGPGGYEAAIEASKVYGMKVALVEARELGGTCLNRGCIPTKTLLHSADLLYELKTHGEHIGLTGHEGTDCDMAALHARKNEVVDQLVAGIGSLMKMNKVTVYHGLGSLVDANHVRVALSDGCTDDLEAKNIMIATGSVPAFPPIPGAESDKVVTSDELLDLDHKVDELIIVGGGVIGCEFASVFSSLGTKVTIVEALPAIIANLDKELGRSLSMIFKKSKGIDIHTGAMVTAFKEDGDRITCCYTEKGKECEVSGDLVLMSIGRRANTAGLIAEDASDEIKGLLMERGCLVVGPNYMTSVAGIYAIGDVIGGIQLAHVATAEGKCAVAFMNGAVPPVDVKAIPSCIYTSPEIASVGLSEQEAKDAEIPVKVGKVTMFSNGRTVIVNGDRGFMKVLAHAETKKILGVQMMGVNVSDMIGELGLAIANGLTPEDLLKAMRPHPTFEEALTDALRDLSAKLG